MQKYNRYLNKQFFILLLLAFAAYGQQQERVAIINTVDDGDSIKPSDLAYLTGRLRETAVNILPKQRYGVMTTESIIAFLGSQERAMKECKAAICLAELGRKVSADYVAQAHIGRFGKQLSINFELYNSKSGNLIGSFMGNSKDIFGLLIIIDEKAPALFQKMPGVSGTSVASPSIAGGISGLEKAADYELGGEKNYLVNLNTEPAGAVLSFDGVPSSKCAKTPCKAELHGGNVRILAALEQYETADTTVSITYNNQNIFIKLKSNFGVLEIKSAYLDGIGNDRQWDLSINGKPNSLGEIRLSPNKYTVRLNHECYENVGFDVGINKGKREIFDMAGNITLKKGGLALSAEKNGEPVSEPVFVNGKQVGETPFSGSVPLCAKVEIGKGREAVDVKLKHNEKVKHTHSHYASKHNGMNSTANVRGKSFIGSRDGKEYKMIVIGKQTWMAENLNYNADGSKCYDNKPANCDKYGRLYDWNTAKTACPSGWHLPSDKDWNVLMKFVNPNCSDNSNCEDAGTKLKAISGWNTSKGYKAGTDDYGFAALPGGYGSSNGKFNTIGNYGYWWSASEYVANLAYNRIMNYNSEGVYGNLSEDNYLFSVRCVKD
ncbi:MAG: PEGA domain-containing protein [Fibromonadaceae bacterium]|jgi:uncharacterized protein (TIGR02145 family)|nr:PEGA domain-containing protein [Fibromonadaceae bacterium]